MSLTVRNQVKLAVIALAVGLAFTAGTALAANPHFIKCNSTLDSDNNLVVSWKEAGLGDNELIDYRATADATAVYACKNNGGNFPNDPKKQAVSGPVSASGTFASGKNGQITASLTLEPPTPDNPLECPGGQTSTLVEISYSNIEITDTTNGITQACSPSSLSACVDPDWDQGECAP